MQIKVFWCEEFHSWISSEDPEAVAEMVRDLRDPENDTTRYETADGVPIWSWPMEADPEGDDFYSSSAYGDYSPASPWSAPGMSTRDFI